MTADRQDIAVRPDDHTIGPDTAEVTVVGYCDFECPYCGQAYFTIKELRGRLGNRLRFVFRHFPLIDKHPFAQQAAEAAEAAACQDRFWAMHDVLFEYQGRLAGGDFSTLAGIAGLDVPRFKQELDGRMFSSRVVRDIRSGRRYGVDGTPTFFLNNVRLSDSDRLEHVLLRAA